MKEVWFIDDAPLQTFAYGVQLISEGHGLPPIRGSNTIIPFRHGSKAYTKYYGERRISLAMYVIGGQPSGIPPERDTAFSELYANLDEIRKLFGRRDSLLTLKRVLPDGSERTAEVEVVGTMDFDNVRGALARFVVDMAMPDPFWKGPSTTTTLDPWNSSPDSFVVVNDGNFDVTKMVITVNDECQNPKIALAGTSIYVEVLVTMGAGDVLVIDTENYTAELNGSSVLGSLNHQGDPAFFKLVSGSNTLTVTSDIAPSADIAVAFQPAFL